MKGHLFAYLVSFFFIFLSIPFTSSHVIGLEPSVSLPLEHISSFHSDIEVHQDTSISITETIVYQTQTSRRGIYRYIPTEYSQDNLRLTMSVVDISVEDENGQDIQYLRSQDGPFLNLRIGDPNQTFTGERTYIISYKVLYAISEFESGPELYWDITGEGWSFPILESSASVYSDFAQIREVDCFSGKHASDDGLCQFEFSQNRADFTYQEIIDYGDNMTILVGFDENSKFIFPGRVEKAIFWFRDNWIFLLLPLPFIFIIFYYLKRGRDFEFLSANVFSLDPKRPTRHRPPFIRDREPFVYEPLKHLTPGETGTIINSRADDRDVVAEILELARKGYLQIKREEKKGIIFTSQDYVFKKKKNANGDLSSAQDYLFKNLFKNSDEVKLSDLKGSFHTHMKVAKDMLKRELVNKSVYTKEGIKARSKAVAFVIFSSALLIFGVLKILIPLHIIWPMIFVVSQFVFLLVFSILYFNQKTAVGTNLYLQSRGLRKTINYGKWREKIKEKHLFIEEVLPFAVALGVVDRLSRDMRDLNIKPPDYVSHSSMAGLSTSNFVSDLSKSVSSNLSYNPSSSSSSGGSGFSGGSSGGGRGGGGGGSW